MTNSRDTEALAQLRVACVEAERLESEARAAHRAIPAEGTSHAGARLLAEARATLADKAHRDSAVAGWAGLAAAARAVLAEHDADSDTSGTVNPASLTGVLTLIRLCAQPPVGRRSNAGDRAQRRDLLAAAHGIEAAIKAAAEQAIEYKRALMAEGMALDTAAAERRVSDMLRTDKTRLVEEVVPKLAAKVGQLRARTEQLRLLQISHHYDDAFNRTQATCGCCGRKWWQADIDEGDPDEEEHTADCIAAPDRIAAPIPESE